MVACECQGKGRMWEALEARQDGDKAVCVCGGGGISWLGLRNKGPQDGRPKQ